jgi:hypothetical protein
MERLISESAIHERLGLRTLDPLVIPSKARRVNLRRFKVGSAVYLSRSDVCTMLRTESEALGGDQVLDRLADLIMEVTT